MDPKLHAANVFHNLPYQCAVEEMRTIFLPKFIFLYIHFVAFKFIRSASRIKFFASTLSHGSDNPCCYTIVQLALPMHSGRNMNHFPAYVHFPVIHYAEFRSKIYCDQTIFFLPLLFRNGKPKNPCCYTIMQFTLPIRSASRKYSFPSLLHSSVNPYCC